MRLFKYQNNPMCEGVSMKGIILAGGSGTRLYPSTMSISKQLVPVFDKPMIYYPLSVLMLAGLRDILIITTPQDQPLFKQLLGNGQNLGIKLTYEIQPEPGGLAQAFIIGKKFIGDDSCCLILGDNIYYGYGFSGMLEQCVGLKDGAIVFGYNVKDPERYGVAEINQDGKVISLEEKPTKPKSNYAVTGLYFYDNDVVRIASELRPSSRGELEITDVNKVYLESGKLSMKMLGRGFAWLDTGTHESLLDASNFIATIENRQGLKIACLEEIALNKGYISLEQFIKIARTFKKNQYGEYLLKLAAGENGEYPLKLAAGNR
jgi:glucose-1-phosphate thymidylyltransferase